MCKGSPYIYPLSKVATSRSNSSGLEKSVEVCPVDMSWGGKRGKRDVYCDEQVEKAVTVLNCVLKGSWKEVRSRSIRKKLKSEYAAYLESKFRRNDRGSI